MIVSQTIDFVFNRTGVYLQVWVPPPLSSLSPLFGVDLQNQSDDQVSEAWCHEC